MASALDTAAQQAYAAYVEALKGQAPDVLAASSSSGINLPQLLADQESSGLSVNSAQSTWLAAAKGSADADLGTPLVVAAMDLQCTNHEESEVYAALLALDGWAQKLGVQNFVLEPLGGLTAGEWQAEWDAKNQAVANFFGLANGEGVNVAALGYGLEGGAEIIGGAIVSVVGGNGTGLIAAGANTFSVGIGGQAAAGAAAAAGLTLQGSKIGSEILKNQPTNLNPIGTSSNAGAGPAAAPNTKKSKAPLFVAGGAGLLGLGGLLLVVL
jgi:hypothetical protein